MPKNGYYIEIVGFSFEPSSGSLRDPDGQEIGLRPQTCRVLALLAAHPGELVAKDRIMDEVWADTHVTDDSLVQCISEIRKALGPEDGGLLMTVPKQGYRLDLPQIPRPKPRQGNRPTT